MRSPLRLLGTTVIAVALLASPSAAAESDSWEFKTPGEAAYCRGEPGGFICVTPNDGFWIRLTGTGAPDDPADVTKGYSARFRGLRATAGRVLGFGQVYYSSDAEVITCWSRRSGLTCKHYEGLSFWLGRFRGYRIFYVPPGIAPRVQPLFRTPRGIRCGLAETFEPSSPILSCWRPSDGVVLHIGHMGRRGEHSRNENAIRFRPPGFSLLDHGRTFRWRCRRVNSGFADRCSTSAGLAVFTCISTPARLTCWNRKRHGFWASARSFYVF